jgi:hypothetical protein
MQIDNVSKVIINTQNFGVDFYFIFYFFQKCSPFLLQIEMDTYIDDLKREKT